MSAPFAPVAFLPAAVDVERRSDGILILRAPVPLAPYPRCLGEHLERWARERPDGVFLAEREGRGWRTLTWAEARRRVRAIAAGLLERGLSADRPVAILSGNSIEHALLALAAMHVGVPVAPVSPAYSLQSRDFGRLRTVTALIEPGLVFADDGRPFAAALAALGGRELEVVVARGAEALARPAVPFEALAVQGGGPDVERAFARVGPDTIAKFLFTSGSTAEPKAVVNTQRMLCSNQQSLAQAWPFLDDEPPVLVDWLPWSHTFGGNNNVGLVLAHGGTLYIDDGRPAPGLIGRTVENLREVSPTVYYNVPRGYDMLLPSLEGDATLRHRFFARLRVALYAGAALPANLWERLERLSLAELGRRVRLASGWGATETAPQVTLVHFEPIGPGVIGLPTPGCEVKMVPLHDGDRYELRVRGPNVTPGYWKRPDLTAAAFDAEGYYRIGDAGRFADPADPAKGIEFAGRLGEEFKLSTGTWVPVGALRVRAISALAPVAQDLVIAGHDRAEIGLLIVPSLAGCRSLCPELPEEGPPEGLLADPRVRRRVRDGMASLRAAGGGSSSFATRALFLAEPPSIDAGEITDKGYLNQRAVLGRRAALVARLYAEPAPPEVIRLG